MHLLPSGLGEPRRAPREAAITHDVIRISDHKLNIPKNRVRLRLVDAPRSAKLPLTQCNGPASGTNTLQRSPRACLRFPRQEDSAAPLAAEGSFRLGRTPVRVRMEIPMVIHVVETFDGKLLFK